MDTNHIEQDDKKWDRAWTTDEIRKSSGNWTLAGDVGLYNLLTEFSQTIISRTHEVENAVDSLMYKTKMANAKISNVINDFHMLSNIQFVENRVYDEEISASTPEVKPAEKTKEQKEAEMLPKIIKAVELGLHVLDQAFNKINVNEISDSEDEDLSSEGRTILEPKDPYEQRPLPYIIGSDEFQSNDYAGLQDLLEEDADDSAEVESSSSDSEETSTDEEEPLPFDEEPFTSGPKQNARNEYSSSEESELFGSEKDENGFISDSSIGSKLKGDAASIKTNEEIKSDVPSKPTSISNLQSKLNLEKVLPTLKKEEKKESNDLFLDDEPSDDESPFRKKTGLFQSDIRFDEEKDMFGNDLFGDLPKENQKVTEKPKPAPEKVKTSSVPKKKDEPSLFDNDEDSDDDIFKTIVSSRKNTAVAKEPSINRQESSDKADSSSTPSSTPSSKHAGRSFNFLSAGGPSDSLFGDESDVDDLFSSKKPQKTFGFDATETDDDDLFGFGKTSKKAEMPSKEKKDTEANVDKDSSLFEASSVADKSYKRIGQPLPGLVPVKTQEKPEKSSESPKSFIKLGQPLPGLVKKKDSIFEDSDSSGQDEKSTPKLPQLKKRDSLFGGDDDEDDDIFSQAPKKLLSPGRSPSATNKAKEPEKDEIKAESGAKIDKKSPETSLFNTEDDDFGFSSIKSAKSEKKTSVPNLFGDEEEDLEWDIGKKPSVPSQKDKIKDSSLFEDSDNFDLFNPKAKPKPVKASILTDSSEEDSLFKTSTKKEAPTPKREEKIISNEESVPKVTNKTEDIIPSPKTEPFKNKEEDVKSDLKKDFTVPSKTMDSSIPVQNESSDDLGVGFDAPVNTSNTLHAINKDRAKIASKKRRPPTKKGRMAALESSSSEKELQPSDSELPKPSHTEPPKPSLTEPPKSTDDLFSSPSEALPTPATTHKAQEKKKMNLMSQLMSEAASSKVLKKAPLPKPVEDEDDVDIFSEVLSKDRSKSRGFSFKEPIESTVKKEKEEDLGPVEADGDNDDFFAEPSFRSTEKKSEDSLDFRNSISHKNSILDLDDDDDDDLFSSIKTTPLKPKPKASESDIFGDDTDIFAELQKEKYEMFPSQLYDEDEDDIFSNLGQTSNSSGATSSKPTNSLPAKKEAEKKPVFDDPLSGLLGDD